MQINIDRMSLLFHFKRKLSLLNSLSPISQRSLTFLSRSTNAVSHPSKTSLPDRGFGPWSPPGRVEAAIPWFPRWWRATDWTSLTTETLVCALVGSSTLPGSPVGFPYLNHGMYLSARGLYSVQVGEPQFRPLRPNGKIEASFFIVQGTFPAKPRLSSQIHILQYRSTLIFF